MHEFGSKDLKRLFRYSCVPGTLADPRGAHPSGQESRAAELFFPGPHRPAHGGLAAGGQDPGAKHQSHPAADPPVAPGRAAPERAVDRRHRRPHRRARGSGAARIGDGSIRPGARSHRQGRRYSAHRPARWRGTADRMRRRAAVAPEEQFEQALELEETDVQAAHAAYEACLAADAQHVEARLNLGRLLHIDGRLERGGRGLSRRASAKPSSRSIVAVLLEDLDREAEAISDLPRSVGARSGTSPMRTSTWRGFTSAPASRRTRCATCSPTGG